MNPLSTYLNDHYAGSTLGLDHARQLEESLAGTAHEAEMTRIANAIEEDRETLDALIKRLDVTHNKVKAATAWVAEKAGRVKFSGATTADRALGTFLALETMSLGVEGKRCLWIALRDVADGLPPLSASELDELIARAEDQRRGLEEMRQAFAREALVRGLVQSKA